MQRGGDATEHFLPLSHCIFDARQTAIRLGPHTIGADRKLA